MRINKFLASCGVASRRKAEELITSGRVLVNDIVQTNLAYIVKPDDVVKLDNKIVSQVETLEYYILNKPKGYISSVKDDRGRRVVTDLIKTDARIFPVGRLDYDSEGMLLLTNDGDLMNKLTHPKNLISKTYIVSILGDINESTIKKLESG
ncbi:MAG: pseudouridine synthase, partial [Christensenellales bacterium]